MRPLRTLFTGSYYGPAINLGRYPAGYLPLNVAVQLALRAHKAGLRAGRQAFTESFRLLMAFLLRAREPS